ncbi:MAG: hypothetical protein HY810_04170 [Candidatus Omnitrophica bacterium]|nr:hypothetical protein [Candidatus Omnitrophota bacterium]
MEDIVGEGGIGDKTKLIVKDLCNKTPKLNPFLQETRLISQENLIFEEVSDVFESPLTLYLNISSKEIYNMAVESRGLNVLLDENRQKYIISAKQAFFYKSNNTDTIYDNEVFFEVIKPGTGNMKDIVAKIKDDFSSNLSQQSASQKTLIFEGVQEAGKRVVGVGSGILLNNYLKSVKEEFELPKFFVKGMKVLVKDQFQQLIKPKKITMSNIDQSLIKEIFGEVEKELGCNWVDIVDMNFLQNPITDKEAAIKNAKTRLVSIILGFSGCPGIIIGTASKFIKMRDYDGTQTDYMVTVTYERGNQKYYMELDYRVGEYYTSEGDKEFGVIKASMTIEKIFNPIGKQRIGSSLEYNEYVPK